MTIKLKTSKTDQFGKRYTSNALEPPYEAMVDYVKLQESKEGSLFLTSHEQPLTRSYFLDNLRKALAHAGVKDANYATQDTVSAMELLLQFSKRGFPVPTCWADGKAPPSSSTCTHPVMNYLLLLLF